MAKKKTVRSSPAKKTAPKKTAEPQPKRPRKTGRPRGRPKIEDDRKGTIVRLPLDVRNAIDIWGLRKRMPSRHSAIIAILEKALGKQLAMVRSRGASSPTPEDTDDPQ